MFSLETAHQRSGEAGQSRTGDAIMVNRSRRELARTAGFNGCLLASTPDNARSYSFCCRISCDSSIAAVVIELRQHLGDRSRYACTHIHTANSFEQPPSSLAIYSKS